MGNDNPDTHKSRGRDIRFNKCNEHYHAKNHEKLAIILPRLNRILSCAKQWNSIESISTYHISLFPSSKQGGTCIFKNILVTDHHHNSHVKYPAAMLKHSLKNSVSWFSSCKWSTSCLLTIMRLCEKEEIFGEINKGDSRNIHGKNVWKGKEWESKRKKIRGN